MNTESIKKIPAELLGHLATFESRSGLMRMQLHLSLQRLAWNWLVRGTSAVKRLIDIVVSAAAIAAFSPVFAIVSLLVRLDGGPVFFAQTRVGRHGREFKMFKFRSMRMNAEKLLADLMAANKHADGVTFKIKNDPRVTRIGKWIRRFSVDELPQLYNVLIGDMSLVGPRPPLPREVALYSLADRRRLSVKPGITCIWQVSGRAEIDFSGQVRLDVIYIETQSLIQDIKILFKTPGAVVFGSGAY